MSNFTISEPKARGRSSTSLSEFITSLESPLNSLQEVEEVLSWPLTTLLILPTGFEPARNANIQAKDAMNVAKCMISIQHVIFNSILPTWLIPMEEAGRARLLKAFFCPSREAQEEPDSTNLAKIAMSGLFTLLTGISSLSTKEIGPAAILTFSVATISDIISQYPLDEIYDAQFFSGSATKDNKKELQECQDFIKIFCSVPTKLATVLAADPYFRIPSQLEQGPYFSNLCVQTEKILFKVSQHSRGDTLLQSLNVLMLKLLNLGLFPAVQNTLPSHASFFTSNLPTIQRRIFLATSLITSSDAAYCAYLDTWAAVVQSLPLMSQQVLLSSLLASLDCHVGMDKSPSAIRKIRMGANILRSLIGKLDGAREDSDMWASVPAVVCGSRRIWDLGVVRAIVLWIADPKDLLVDKDSLSKMLDVVISVWTNPDHIRHALLREHTYLTSFVLIILAAIREPPKHLALSPPFISSISTYLTYFDDAIRRCGMLVAEVVATRCRQTLNFDGWDGQGETFIWAKDMRNWVNDWELEGYVEHREIEETVTSQANTREEAKTEEPGAGDPSPPPSGPADSDDESLSGYSTSSRSSRTPSPTPSELAEIEKDPSLRVGRSKPIARPVYLGQLASMLRMDKDDKDSVERIEVALASAESLIRRKKGFGFELEENAAELTMSLTRLRNNYDLNGFDEKRQNALIALVACCPRQSAQALIEQFFTNQYSMSDRITMLCALAIGARALAGLPVPPSSDQLTQQFPSKMLPAPLHLRYATPEEHNLGGGRVQKLLGGITTGLLEQSREDAEAALADHPEFVREKRLRVDLSRPPGTGIQVLSSSPNLPSSTKIQKKELKPDPDTFTVIAAENFIMPLVNHMWLHLRDANTRTGHYGGAGTAVVFDAAVLTEFLSTLAVLVHAARNSPSFLAIISPAALELAMTLGSRTIKVSEENEGSEKPWATVLTAGLEVALITLDGSSRLDQGKTLALEHGVLLKGCGVWAGEVLDAADAGKKMVGGGGETEGKLAAAAAGVVVSVQKMAGRWGRSMRPG